MTTQTKWKQPFTTEQKLDYAKQMIEEGYSNQQVMEIFGASSSAMGR